MSLWVDKYRPQTLENLSYHQSITDNLKALSKSGDFPHLLIYGPSGAGKKTRVYSTLQEIYGIQVTKLKIDVKTFTTASNRKLEFNVLSSPYHLEITPSDMGNNDRVVIQDLLKDVASVEHVDFTGKSSSSKHRFKIVIINEADSLSRDAQAALRRTMEKYSSNIRLILVCNSISNIIPPIKSRTLLVRIPSPSNEEVASILLNVAEAEEVKFSSVSEAEIQAYLVRVSILANRNLRKALLSFETLCIQNETVQLNSALDSLTLDWELIIRRIAHEIKQNRNVATLAKIRVTFYELLAHCIPARIILKTLLFDIIGMVDPKVISKLVELGSIFDERLSLGQKSIFHLEGFVAKAMVVIEKA